MPWEDAADAARRRRGHHAARSPGPAGSAVDGLLEARARAEPRYAAGRDLNRLAGLGIAALTGVALGDVELPEAGDCDLAATAEALLDRLEHGLDRNGGLGLARVGLRGDLLDELRLVHGSSSVVTGRQDARGLVGRYARASHGQALRPHRRSPPRLDRPPAAVLRGHG